MPPSRRLPPLKSIEAFVEVARSLNFTRAGEALNITTSAISRRVQILENDLGVRLLTRSTTGVCLTAAGERYFESVSRAFSTLRRASSDVVQARERGHLRIIAPESFLSIWLMPRLPRFYAENGDTDLQIDSIGYFESFTRNEVDIAFKVARTPPRGHAERVLSLTRTPVCSPAFLAAHPIQAVGDLADIPLITLSTMPDAWDDWFRLAGHPALTSTPNPSLSFDLMSLVLGGAANGMGVALGIEQLCENHFRNGTLVAPLGERVSGEQMLFFVCRPEDLSRTSVRRFREWIMQEAATIPSS